MLVPLTSMSGLVLACPTEGQAYGTSEGLRRSGYPETPRSRGDENGSDSGDQLWHVTCPRREIKNQMMA